MVNNFKSIKLPSLSTSFSESGKSAKRRFDNILSTRAKKTGVFAFALILLIVGIVGIIFGFNSDKDISYACKTFDCSFDLPKSWENKYEIEERNNIVYVYHKAIRQEYGEGTGLIFYIERLSGDKLSHEDITDPGNRTIALQGGGYTYVFGMPTDVQYPIWEGGDKALADDYLKMTKDNDKIKKSIKSVSPMTRSGGRLNMPGTAIITKDTDLSYTDLQREVDNGHQPWRLDPLNVARDYVYNTLNKNGGEFEVYYDDSATGSITYSYTKPGEKEIQVVVYQPIKKDNSGIWVVSNRSIIDYKISNIIPSDRQIIVNSGMT